MWQKKHYAMLPFFETTNHIPPKNNLKERGLYLNWIKHNRKVVIWPCSKKMQINILKKCMVLTYEM